jgi:hypothetical protein
LKKVAIEKRHNRISEKVLALQTYEGVEIQPHILLTLAIDESE